MEKKLVNNVGYFSGTTLVIIAFSVAFYARIFCSMTHAPSFLVHAHFLIVPITFVIVLFTALPVNRKQISVVTYLSFGLFLLFLVNVASALLNQAGLVNVLFEFSMLGGPFIFLATILFIPMSWESLCRFRWWIIFSSFANMGLAFIQYPLLESGKISAGGLDGTDGMAGVFFVSGAGNYVSTSVSLYFGLYYFFFLKSAPYWLRIGTLACAIFQLQLSDSKQVLLALVCGWGVLSLISIKDISKTTTYLFLILIFGVGFFWCIENVEAFGAFKNYLDKDGIYAPDGEANRIKFIAFRALPNYYHSFLNVFLGLGPGHTVGRLGGWLIKENWKILGPLGATQHPASAEIISAYNHSWLAMESTVFAPLYGWAGIWGDLGFLGLCIYLFLAFVVWKYVCFDDFSRFLLLSVAIFGFIFTQMEEPGFMLYVAALLGMSWHEHRFAEMQSH